MQCPNCGSENVNVQVVNVVQIKDNKPSYGCLWWLFIGWWWIPIKWLIIGIPLLLIRIFGKKKQTVVNRGVAVKVCQNCGKTWQ